MQLKSNNSSESLSEKVTNIKNKYNLNKPTIDSDKDKDKDDYRTYGKFKY